MTIAEALASFGISGLTALAVAYGGAKFFGSKLTEAILARRLEGFKAEGQRQLEEIRHENTAQLEKLRFERADLLDRAAKLNQREFEVIPEIWKRATEAHFAAMRLIAIWQESPDVGRMSEPEFEDFLSNSRLKDWQKEEIRSKNRWDRTTYYSDISAWLRLNDANEAVVHFNRALLGSSIFVHPETFSKFEEFGQPLRDAFNSFRIGKEMGEECRPASKNEEDPIGWYRKNGSKLYEGLGLYLRERYWVSADGKAV